MSIPYLPLYVTDYEGDTAHLSVEEDGAYLRLLRLCWRTSGCSIPNDPVWIARMMRVDAETFERLVAPLIAEFLSTDRKGRLHSARLTEEWRRITATAKARSAAGKKGGRPRKALKTNETDQSPAKAKQKHPEPEPEPEKREAKASTKSRATRLSEDWFLPREWGEWATEKTPLSPQQIRTEADKFRDHWIAKSGSGATKADWFATWRNWCRNARPSQPPKGSGNDRLARKLARFTGSDDGPEGGSQMASGPGGDPAGTLLPLRVIGGSG